MKFYFNIVFFFATILIFSSCVDKKNVDASYNYMQNIEKVATEVALKKSTSTIQVGDQFVILFTAKDDDVVRPFNKNYSSGQLVQNLGTGNTPNTSTVTVSGPTYIVDERGNIDMPVLGIITTTGKTIEELKDELRDKISQYVKNPTVNIRITNFRVSVLGDVARPGEYVFPDKTPTLLTALSTAGDITTYGRRDNILIVRNKDGVLTNARVNIADASFFESPYYQLKQGDVLYVSANSTKEKTSRLDPKTPIYIAVAGAAIAAAGIIVTIFKK